MENNLFRLLSYFLFFIVFFSCASGQKTGKLKTENRVILYSGDTVLHFYTLPAKQKRNLHPDRFYFWFNIDTILATQGSYNERLLNGLYQSYYPNKNLWMEGMYQNGLKNGIWKEWYPTGHLMRIYNWKRGSMEGAFIEYDPGGRKKFEGKYRRSQLSGDFVHYDSTGKEARTFYKSGLPITTDSTKSKEKHARPDKSNKKGKK